MLPSPTNVPTVFVLTCYDVTWNTIISSQHSASSKHSRLSALDEDSPLFKILTSLSFLFSFSFSLSLSLSCLYSISATHHQDFSKHLQSECVAMQMDSDNLFKAAVTNSFLLLHQLSSLPLQQQKYSGEKTLYKFASPPLSL